MVDDYKWGRLACRAGLHHWCGWWPVQDCPDTHLQFCVRCGQDKLKTDVVIFTWYF